MPIASRNLQLLGNRPDLGDGVKSWRVDGTDSRGRPWKHGTFKVTLAEAEVIRDAITAESLGLAETDKAELLEGVHALNTVASFDFTGADIIEEEGEDHIFKWFMESLGADAITVAWWMDDINTGKFNAITTRMNIVEHRLSITSRFEFMVLVNPWYDLTVETP